MQSDPLVLSSLTISALIRCTTLVPVLHSRAVLRMPLPLASAERIAASFDALILARPIGLPLFGALLSRPGKPSMYHPIARRST